MEVNEDGLLKELLSLDGFYADTWEFDTCNGISSSPPLPSLPTSFDCSFSEICSPFDLKCTPPTPSQEHYTVSITQEENNQDKKKKKLRRKVEGQPSKNLMAERRRRRRLNDRLSILRSVVPKTTKTDRISILVDAIGYMKQLIERINSLKEELNANSRELPIFKGLTQNDSSVTTSPKFDVERRDADTRIEIQCMEKPGMLLSTMTVLETMGLQIQQCVVSCFDGFSLHASCSEELKHATTEEIKQALFRNAGYG